MKIDSYKLSASITHRLEVGLTGWGGGAAGKTLPGPLAPNLMDQFVKALLVIKSFASLDQPVWRGSVNPHRAPVVWLALVGAPLIIPSYYSI